MRATVACAAVALAAALGSTASSAGTARPSLRLVGDTVRGVHFVPHERVRVTFMGSERVVRRLRTSSAGTFSTAEPQYDPCVESLVILAVGASGDSARLKLPQRACPPPARSGA